MKTRATLDLFGLNIQVSLSKSNPLYFIMGLVHWFKTMLIVCLMIIGISVLAEMAIIYHLIAR